MDTVGIVLRGANDLLQIALCEYSEVKRLGKGGGFLEALAAVAAVATIGGFIAELTSRTCPHCGHKVTFITNYQCTNCHIHVHN